MVYSVWVWVWACVHRHIHIMFNIPLLRRTWLANCFSLFFHSVPSLFLFPRWHVMADFEPNKFQLAGFQWLHSQRSTNRSNNSTYFFLSCVRRISGRWHASVVWTCLNLFNDRKTTYFIFDLCSLFFPYALSMLCICVCVFECMSSLLTFCVQWMNCWMYFCSVFCSEISCMQWIFFPLEDYY